MRELVRQREHLRGLRVGAVDENQGGDIVDQRKPPELLRIELAASVAADNAGHHDQDAELVRLLDEAAQRLRPGREVAPFLQVEPERPAHPRRDRFDIVRQAGRTDERQRVFPLGAGELPVPVLALLAEIDRVEEVQAGPADRRAADGAEIGDRERFVGRLGREEISDPGVHGLREFLELFESRANIAALPLAVSGEFADQRVHAYPGALAAPAQHLRFDIDAKGGHRRSHLRKCRNTPSSRAP